LWRLIKIKFFSKLMSRKNYNSTAKIERKF
jgi:hypothetical protein